jgi:transposase
MRQIPKSSYNDATNLLNSGKSIREVAKRVGISSTTVSRIRKNLKPGLQNSKGGRPAILSDEDKRYCVRLVTKEKVENAVKVKKHLGADLGIQVSPDTIRRVLRSSGLGAIEKSRKPALEPRNARKRLAWCKKYRSWTIDDWKRVVWSDETKINRFNSDGRIWAWIRDGETIQPKHVKGTYKHNGGGILLWSAITYAGTGWMCQICGNMDKLLYKEILEDEQSKTIDFLCEKMKISRDQVYFQHDNDPKHTSNLVKEYLEQQDYRVLDWPPQSPDLNPIENMWQLLKIRLNEFETPAKGMNELYERVVKIWYDVITKEECQKVIESMPKRIDMCIKANGYWTKY